MSDWTELDRERLRRALASPAPLRAREPLRWAAVAVLLAPTARGVDVLLIRRSERPSDPWSGHMALPGGHRDAADETLLHTAVRETFEEVGVDLARDAELLGELDDVSPVAPRALVVRPFVFALSRVPELSPSAEVDEGVWANMHELASGNSASEYELVRQGQQYRFPAFRVGSRQVWGLTYRVLSTLLDRVAAYALESAYRADRPRSDQPLS